MIRRYLPNETTYTHNKYVLSPIKTEVEEKANDLFELEIEVMRDVVLNNGDILTAPTPRGEQPFRVYRIVRTLKGKRAYARHLFYDLVNNFLVDVRPDGTCDYAIKHILSNTAVPTGFTGSSDVVGSNSAYYIRKNPVEAIMGADNSILKTWGGNLVRNGKNIQIKANGNDRGFEIRLGKNLIGIEDDSDENSVVTRLYPTVVLEDQQVYALPELYVDSPQIGNYPTPRIKEERIELTDDEKAYPIADIYTLMRTHCNNLYSIDNIDKPVANYKIDFVQLGKVARIEQEVKYTIEGMEQLTYDTIETLTYEQLEGVTTVQQFIDLLEQVDLYDLVNIRVFDLNLKAKVVGYRYDCLKERYINIELGGFKPSAKYQTANIIKQLQYDLEKQKGLIASAREYATEIITGNKGGYVVTRKHPDGTPYEILIMDTDDIQTASNVIRFNQQGIGFSQVGYNGPFTTAILIDGTVVAGTGFFNSLVTNLIQSDLGSSLNLQSNTAIQALVQADASKTAQLNAFADLIEARVTQQQVQDLIDEVNRANPNLVSNFHEKWEQGDLNSSGSAVSLNHIRTINFYPIRQGHVYYKISPLYEVKILIYDSAYNFIDTTSFAGEGTFLLNVNAYFKVVIKRLNGSAILPEAIDTAEIKIENSDTPTQFTPYWGDLTLDQQLEYFILEVTSDNGWTVDQPGFSATFTAKIYLFNEDVTMRFEPMQFTWFKQYPGGELISLGNGTTKIITGTSIEKSATISCVFEIYDTIYTLVTFNGDTLLTIADDTIMVIGYV